jgi:hypothetical protein
VLFRSGETFSLPNNAAPPKMTAARFIAITPSAFPDRLYAHDRCRTGSIGSFVGTLFFGHFQALSMSKLDGVP